MEIWEKSPSLAIPETGDLPFAKGGKEGFLEKYLFAIN